MKIINHGKSEVALKLFWTGTTEGGVVLRDAQCLIQHLY